jgi:hypothetical protein
MTGPTLPSKASPAPVLLRIEHLEQRGARVPWMPAPSLSSSIITQLCEPALRIVDPNVWSGRASQEVFVDLVAVRSCINVFGLSLGRDVLRAIMDISARALSLAVRPRTGHSGHQCSHAPVRPILHLVSSSRRPRRETGCGTTSLRAPCLRSFFVRAVRPFLRPGLQLVPGHRAQGPSRLARLWRRRFQAMA